jgi:hypothetical protein
MIINLIKFYFFPVYLLLILLFGLVRDITSSNVQETAGMPLTFRHRASYI